MPPKKKKLPTSAIASTSYGAVSSRDGSSSDNLNTLSPTRAALPPSHSFSSSPFTTSALTSTSSSDTSSSSSSSSSSSPSPTLYVAATSTNGPNSGSLRTRQARAQTVDSGGPSSSSPVFSSAFPSPPSNSANAREPAYGHGYGTVEIAPLVEDSETAPLTRSSRAMTTPERGKYQQPPPTSKSPTKMAEQVALAYQKYQKQAAEDRTVRFRFLCILIGSLLITGALLVLFFPSIKPVGDGSRSGDSPLGDVNAITVISFVSNTYVWENNAHWTRLMMIGKNGEWRQMSGVQGMVLETGDHFHVKYRNSMNESESIHIRSQTPQYFLDGVPFLSALPLPANRSGTSTFPIAYGYGRSITGYFESQWLDHPHRGMAAPFLIRTIWPYKYLDALCTVHIRALEMRLQDLYVTSRPTYDKFEPLQQIHVEGWKSEERKSNWWSWESEAEEQQTTTNHNSPQQSHLNTASSPNFTSPIETFSASSSSSSSSSPASSSSPDFASSSTLSISYLAATNPAFTSFASSSAVIDENFPNLYHELDSLSDVVFFIQDICPSDRSLSECMTSKDRHHLANGNAFTRPVTIWKEPSSSFRLRVINAAGITNYKVLLGQLNGTLVAVDGQYVSPQSINSFWLAAGQRADIVISLPRWRDFYPLIAVGEGEHGRQSGIVVVTNERDVPHHQYSIHPSERVHHMSDPGIKQEMELRSWFELPNHVQRRAPDVIVEEIDVTRDVLGVWYETLHPRTAGLHAKDAASFAANGEPILVKTNQHVCIPFRNTGSQTQSLHLHGHYFQVTSINGVEILNGAIRDTVFMPEGDSHAPMRLTICFVANNPGVHALHSNYPHGFYTTIEYEH